MSTTIEKPAELELAVVDEQSIKNKIYHIRGQQVMLDFDLAEIYGYEVKRLNEQVRRNIERFPEDFMFQLTKAEIQLISLKSQFATLNEQGNKRGMHIKKLPFAFTEQGIYMLATVLKGELAQAQSIALIRIFKSMKDYIVNNDYLIADKSLLAFVLTSTPQPKTLIRSVIISFLKILLYSAFKQFRILPRTGIIA